MSQIREIQGSWHDTRVVARLRELGYLASDKSDPVDLSSAFEEFLEINGFAGAEVPEDDHIAFLLSEDACPKLTPAPRITGDEIPNLWKSVEAVVKAASEEQQAAAMVDGLLTFGVRFYSTWVELVSIFEGQTQHELYEKLAADCQTMMMSWLKGNALTSRPDEDERRALASVAFLQENPRFWVLSHYCVQSLMELPSGHRLRDERFARNILRAQIRRFSLAPEERASLFALAAIRELLTYRFYVPDDPSVWIERGEELIPTVDDLDESRQFYSTCMQLHIHLASVAKEGGDSASLELARSAAETDFKKMQASETDDDSRARNLISLAALYVLSDQQDRVLDCFKQVLDLGTVNRKTIGLAAVYEARGRLATGEHERIVEVLEPLMGWFGTTYLGAVRAKDVNAAGEQFAEATITLAFAYAALNRWSDVVSVLEMGKSLRLRSRAALRKRPETTRLLEIESEIYALERGIPDQGQTPAKAQIEDWFASNVSPLARLQQQYLESLPATEPELHTGRTVGEIAASLEPDEAFLSIGIWWAGMVAAIITPSDRDAPSHTFHWPDKTQSALIEQLTGTRDADEGFLYALERGIRYADPRPALDRLIAFMDDWLGPPISAALAGSGVRKLTVSPHNLLSFVPFWALPSLAPFEIRLVPAAWYAVEFTSHPKLVARSALAVANPTRDLAGAPAEIASVAFRLEQIGVSTRSLAEDDATEERISEALKDAGIFHFSGHGKNSLLEPLRSSLLVSPDWTQMPLKRPEDLLALSEQVVEWTPQDEESRGAVLPGVGFLLETTNPDNGEVERALEYSRRGTFWALYSPTDLLQSAELWMAGDILIQQVFDNCGLAFLSACGSGVGAIQNIEEGAGLPAALLAGGANAVVSAFWPVDDALTALFVDIFYEQLADDSSGCRLASAVRSASLAIRDMRRDEACERVGAIRDRAGDAAAEFQLDVFVERLRNGPDLPFAHPFDWAAFYVIGASRFEWLPRDGGAQ